MMRTTARFGAVGVVAISISSAALYAGSINVDFNNGGATDQSPGTSAVVGPYATSGWHNNFNVGAVSGPINGLLDHAGAATSATFGFTQGGNALSGEAIYNSGYGASGAANAGLNASQQLYNGAAAASEGGFVQQVNISNVPYTTFDVYVLVRAPVGNQGYGDAGYYDQSSLQMFSGATPGTKYHFASTQQVLPSNFSYVRALSTTITSPTMEANYVLFSGLAGGSGQTYSFVLDSPTKNEVSVPNPPLMFGGDGRISGIQIVEAIPEPASLSALLLGGVGLLSRRRR